MGGYVSPPDFVASFAELRRRLEALEKAQSPPRYTTANRPNAATVEGLIIYNTTTDKHQGSNGVTWTDLY